LRFNIDSAIAFAVYWFQRFQTFQCSKRFERLEQLDRFEPGFRSWTEVMNKEQTFRSEDMPFGIANGKSQIPKYGICNLRSEIPSASEDLLLQVCPSVLTAESGLNVVPH
jgi:hypothetical protein